MNLSSPASTLLIALAAMFWGGDLLLRPGALSSGWSPAKVVLWEHLLLTLVFSIPLWLARGSLARLNRSGWLALLFVAWGGSALATWLYTLSFTLGAPLPAILLQKTQPVFALLGARWLLQERQRSGFWAWCVLALVGAWLLTGILHFPSVHSLRAQQSFCALAAAALWGGATVAGRRLTPVLSPSTLAGARFALAVPLLALLTLIPSHADAPTHTPVTAFYFLLLIVLLPDLMGMGLYYLGLRRTTASAATLAELCYPLTALLVGVLIQHALLSGAQWSGFLCLLAAVLGLSLAPQVGVNTDTPAKAPEEVCAL